MMRITILLAICLFVTGTLSSPVQEDDVRELVDRLRGLLRKPRDSISREYIEEGQLFTLHNDDADQDETFHIDPESDKQFVSVESGEGLGSAAIVDGKRSVMSWYSSETEECYLVAGVKPSVPLQKNDAGDDVIHNRVLYDKVSDKPVSDTSLLSEELQEVCTDKPVFWLQKVAEVDDDQVDDIPSAELRERRGWGGKIVKGIGRVTGLKKIVDTVKNKDWKEAAKQVAKEAGKAAVVACITGACLG